MMNNMKSGWATSKSSKCPNPLFETWLDEWRMEAASRNSKLQYGFAQALRSLRKYPIELKSGRECLILQNFGANLCAKLDRKLAEYKENHCDSTSSNCQAPNVSPKRNERRKDIAPSTKPDYSSKFTIKDKEKKSIEELRKVCPENDVNPVPSLSMGHFSSDSSKMNGITCLKGDECFPFIEEPAKRNHLDFAEIIPGAENSIRNANLNNNKGINSLIQDTASNDADGLSQCCLSNECNPDATSEQLVFLPREFEIILLIDTQENSSKTNQFLNKDEVKNVFDPKVKYEVRHLNLGDFAWIARNNRNEELMLPYIVERKTMNDLAGSIKDGRFQEQKFRLRQCGIHNVTFMVEKFGKGAGYGLPESTLDQAIVNTQIVDEFFVKFTSDHEHSMTYLLILTNLLTKNFGKKTLISCTKHNIPTSNIGDDIVHLLTYQEFSQFSAKNKILKPREMFIKHLIQLNGMSVEKAFVITERYPTLRHLIAAYKTSEKPELLLSTIPYGSLQRNIGPRISKTVYKLYTSPKLK